MTIERAQVVAREISDAHYSLHGFVRKAWPRLFPGTTLKQLAQPGGPSPTLSRRLAKYLSKPPQP
jgi:hypothetical protein